MTVPPPPPPTYPIPIFLLPHPRRRYLIYDAPSVHHLRTTHSILGVLIGTLPQIPQQNVFLGLPLELQPEEVRLLVRKGVAYIVDDKARHDNVDFRKAVGGQREEILARLRREGEEIAREIEGRKKEQRDVVLKKMQAGKRQGKRREKSAEVEKKSDGPDTLTVDQVSDKAAESSSEPSEPAAEQDDKSTAALFDSPAPSIPQTHTLSPSLPSSSLQKFQQGLQSTFSITPTSTYHPLPLPPPSPPSRLPTSSLPADLSYLTPRMALHAHLHSLNYTLTPGLRFGAHFSVYPGDPLRYHSHFLANAYGWDEEVPLIDIIGGGRLGTRVKKGWLIGGMQPVPSGAGPSDEDEGKNEEEEEEAEGEEMRVRTFCIEWGGM